MTQTATLQAWASVHAEQGVPVFPCEPRGTEPLTPHGYEDASTDPAQVKEWWERWPDANIAMPTGIGHGVFDVLETWYDSDDDDDPDRDIHGIFYPHILGDVGFSNSSGRYTGFHRYFHATDRESDYRDRQRIRYHALNSWVLLPGSVTSQRIYRYDSDDDWSESDPEPIDWERCRAILDAETGIDDALKILSGPSVRLENVVPFGRNQLGRSKVYVGNVYMGDVLIDAGSIVGFIPAVDAVNDADAQQATQDVQTVVAGLEKLCDSGKSTTVSAIRRDELKLFNMSSDRKDAAIHRAVTEGLVTKTSGPRNAWILTPVSRQAVR